MKGAREMPGIATYHDLWEGASPINLFLTASEVVQVKENQVMNCEMLLPR